ncbi:MAG: Omp28-related outer membrane protein [Ignavibacteria bacterium]|nr:Omp28-related outer membrane protein [Ignavibacteria bacterium]
MKKNFTDLLKFSLTALVILSGAFFNFTYSSGTVYVLADFENTSYPPSGWTLSNTAQYDWIRTTYASGYGIGSASMVADFYDYQTGNFECMTKNFNATTAGDSLKFDHAYTCYVNEQDRLDIFTSTDGGTSWVSLISLTGGNSGPLKTAPTTADLFVPTPSQWATKTYALPVGTNKVKFTAVTAFGNNLYLDNIKVGVPFATDAGVSGIKSPKWGITPQTAAPTVLVRNYGSVSQTFQVTMTINPGGYTNSATVTNLGAGQTSEIVLPDCNFSTEGAYTMTCYTNLVSDMNLSNDTIVNTLLVSNSPRNVVLELCTGTWCQWCPCGDDEAHHLSVTYPNSVILSYHGAGSDPWKNFNGNGIIGMLGFGGYPSGLVDRRLGAQNGWGSMFTDAEYRYSQSPVGTVNIATNNISYNTVTRELSVGVDVKALTSLSGQYMINFVVKENNLVWAQTGNSYCPGNPTQVHNWVVRNMVNGASGDSIITGGTWNQNQVIPFTFTTTFDSAWIPVNCKFDVVVYKVGSTFNTSEIQQGVSNSVNVIGINPLGTGVPEKFFLAQNYPNPFNPTTNVHFSVPRSGNVSLKIFNTLGQVVAVYLDGFVNAGNYNAEIDGTKLASGIYFYTLSSEDFNETKKMVLIK